MSIKTEVNCTINYLIWNHYFTETDEEDDDDERPARRRRMAERAAEGADDEDVGLLDALLLF